MKKTLCVLISALTMESGAIMQVHAQDAYQFIEYDHANKIGNYYFKNDALKGICYSTSKNGPYTTVQQDTYSYAFTNGKYLFYSKYNGNVGDLLKYDLAHKTSKTILKKINSYDQASHYILFEKGTKKQTLNAYDINKGSTQKLGDHLFLIQADAINDEHAVFAKNSRDEDETAQAYLATFTSDGVKVVNTKQRISLAGKTLGKKAFYYSQPTYTSNQKNVLKASYRFYKIDYNGKHKKYLGSTVLTCHTKIYKTKAGKIDRTRTQDKNRIWTIREHSFTYTNAKNKRITKKFSK